MRYLSDLRLFAAGIVIILVVLGLSPTGASSANISHSHRSTISIKNYSLASIDPTHWGYIHLANSANGSRLLGVTVARNDSLLVVDATNGFAQVATSGSTARLASTRNGNTYVTLNYLSSF